MSKKPEILSTRTVAKSQFFEVEALDLRFSNGEARVYERLRDRQSRSVMIIPMLDEDTVLLVREYGAGIEDYYLGLPKGIIESGETPLVAANRELKEEIGYGAKRFFTLKSLSLSPGYMSKSMVLVLAQDLYPEKLEGDEPEEIEVVPWSLKKLPELMARDDFHGSRSIAALFMVRDLLHG